MRSLLTLIKLTLLIIILQACSKRTVDLEKSSSAFKIRIDKDSISRVQLKTVFYQSAKSFRFTSEEYEFEIIPDGEFTFSPEHGFKGNAKSLKGKGKKTIDEKSESKSSLVKDSISATGIHTKIKGNSKNSDYSKNSVLEPAIKTNTWLIILMIISLIAIPAFVFFKPRLSKLWAKLTSR